MLCILFFCVICEKKIIGDLSWGGFSLTELTDLTEPFGALFEPMRGRGQLGKGEGPAAIST